MLKKKPKLLPKGKKTVEDKPVEWMQVRVDDMFSARKKLAEDFKEWIEAHGIATDAVDHVEDWANDEEWSQGIRPIPE